MRFLSLKLTVLFTFAVFCSLQGKSPPSILIVVPAAEFNDISYQKAFEGFKTAGFRVYTVSWKMTTCKGRNGLKIRPDLGFDSTAMTGYSAVFLVGGPGSSAFWNDPSVHALLKSAKESNKIIAAEGLAVLSLANTGLLIGKRCTGLSTIRNEIFHKRGVFTSDKVTVDGNIMTCNGPDSVDELQKLVVSVLKK